MYCEDIRMLLNEDEYRDKLRRLAQASKTATQGNGERVKRAMVAKVGRAGIVLTVELFHPISKVTRSVNVAIPFSRTALWYEQIRSLVLELIQ